MVFHIRYLLWRLHHCLQRRKQQRNSNFIQIHSSPQQRCQTHAKFMDIQHVLKGMQFDTLDKT